MQQSVVMPEYMIRPVGRSDWVPIPKDQLASVLVPRGYRCQVVTGWGDLRVMIGGAEMAFSGEQVGWSLVFDGDIEGHDTDALAQKVADQLGEYAHESMEWVRYD
jgi:hypothetical protein